MAILVCGGAGYIGSHAVHALIEKGEQVVIVDNLPFLLSDTVGFIRKLPHHLIESFKSTLDELDEADILVHVCDISHPNFEEQYTVVNETIKSIVKDEKTTLVLFNKIDNYSFVEKDEADLSERSAENISLDELEKTYMARLSGNCLFISAKEKTNIDSFKLILYSKVKEVYSQKYPYSNFIFDKYDDLQ